MTGANLSVDHNTLLVILAILLVVLSAILWLGSRRRTEGVSGLDVIEAPGPIPIVAPIDITMAVDTASKRGSAIYMLCPWRVIPIIPDGTIDQGDRQHAAWMYSGILAGAPVVVADGRSEYWRFITLVHNR